MRRLLALPATGLRILVALPATGFRILLGAGVWMAGNLFFYRLYLVLPYRVPPALNVLILFFPVVPAAVAYAWTYLVIGARGAWRAVLTLVALLAWAALLTYFFVFTHTW